MPRSNWRKSYSRRLLLTDGLVLALTSLGTYAVVFRSDDVVSGLWFSDDVRVGYGWVAAIFAVVWFGLLTIAGSRDYRVLGTGTVEYRRVLTTALVMPALIGLFALTFQVEFSRSFTLVALVTGILAVLATRWGWRRWLRPQRRAGNYSSRVVVVGSVAAASAITCDLKTSPEAGYLVVGACVSTGAVAQELPGTGVKVFGTVDKLHEAIKALDADTVLVTGGHNLSPKQMRQLSWSLEPGRKHLVMVPSLTDIAGPRIQTRPVAGLPLIHVETPRFEGYSRFIKRVFDTTVAFGILLVLSPFLLLIAMTIRLSTPGAVFFSHERIGKDGKPFRMLKFRSMVSDADAQLMGLLAAQGAADKPLFKLEDDPRITPIGKFIRKYSIDELPQLINVLRGEMALVGPRPQVAKEVALYDQAAARRLYVKPGMTGAWQVSGRSSLSWEESVRIDLFYIENWSLVTDISIMWRTVRAVLAPSEAEAH